MSDFNLGKKLVEEEHLHRFLEAYATVTGISMNVVSNGESPDFICARPSGEQVGIELARSPHDYDGAVWDRICVCIRPSFGVSITSPHLRRSLMDRDCAG